MAEEWAAEQQFSMIDQFNRTVLTDVAIKGGVDATFELPIETITNLSYATEVNASGFMLSLFHATAVKSGVDQFARIEVANTVGLTRIDGTEEAGRLKWRWIPGTGYSTEDGFFEITLYYCGKFNSSLIAELLDHTDTVKWSSAQSGGWISGSVYNKCGQDILDPAGNLVDNNVLTGWSHSAAEQHWIILDMGASYSYPMFKTYVNTGANPMSLTIYASDNPAVWGTPSLENWDIYPGWNEIAVPPAQGRYLKIVNSVGGDQKLSHWMDFKAKAATKVILTMKSLTWEFKLRVNASTTSGSDWFAEISNVSLKRYKKFGTAQFTLPIRVENLVLYQQITHTATINTGTQIKYQMNFSNNSFTWSGWVGPDNTSNTYYLTGSTITPPPGFETAAYYKWLAFLIGDRRETPILDSITVKELVKKIVKPIELAYSEGWPPPVGVAEMGGNGPVLIKTQIHESQDQTIFESGNKETAIFYPVLPAPTSVIDSQDPALGGNNDIPIMVTKWMETLLVPLFSGMIYYNRIYQVLPAFTDVVPSADPRINGDVLITTGLWTGCELVPLFSGFIHYMKPYPVLPATTDVTPGMNPALWGNTDIPLSTSVWRGNQIMYPDFLYTWHIPQHILVSNGWVSRLGNQVLSGYITDEAGGHFAHPEGMTLIIFSKDGSDIRTNAYLDPVTGFYQIILGYFTYNSRSLLAKQLNKDWDIAYRGYPQDDIIDGTKLIPDRDLAFTLSDIGKDQCPRAVAFVDSLVTY